MNNLRHGGQRAEGKKPEVFKGKKPSKSRESDSPTVMTTKWQEKAEDAPFRKDKFPCLALGSLSKWNKADDASGA